MRLIFSRASSVNAPTCGERSTFGRAATGGSAEAGANEGKNAEQYRNGAALRFLF